MIDIVEVNEQLIKEAASNNESLDVLVGFRFDDIIDNGGDIDNFNDYVQYLILGENSEYVLEDFSYVPVSVTGADIYIEVVAYPVRIV